MLEKESGDDLIGRYAVGRRNTEGQMIVDFSKWMEMAVVMSYLYKEEKHRITCKSGGRNTSGRLYLVLQIQTKRIKGLLGSAREKCSKTS